MILVINDMECIALGTKELKVKLVMELWLNRILKETKTEGFGNRFCIWIKLDGKSNKRSLEIAVIAFGHGEDI